MTDFSWTDDRVEQLKSLWAADMSASQIAAAMGCTSRSAVIGKIHRLNLPTRDKKITIRKPAYVPRERKVVQFRRPRIAQAAATAHTGSKTRQQRMDEAEYMRAVFAAETGPVTGGVTFFDLEPSHCRWPMGDPADLETFRFCGEPKVDDGAGSYCQHHHRMSLPSYLREAAE